MYLVRGTLAIGMITWAYVALSVIANTKSPVTIWARTSRPAYSPVMTTVLRRCHLILVMDSRLSQQSSITCRIVTHS